MEKQIFRLVHQSARANAAHAVMFAPEGWFVKIEPPTRTLEQNSKMHAMFGDIARQELYLGRHLKSPQWKTLFISGHAIATGRGADVVPGLENEFVNIRESSAHMSVARMSSVIEYTYAWGAERNIEWSDEARSKIWLPTE